MQALNNLLGIIFMLLFWGNGFICDLVYTYSKNPLEWIRLRYIIYEVMMLIACWLIYNNSKNKWGKVVFSFGTVFVFGSLIDRIMFDIHTYHLSDLASCLIGLIIAIRVYNFETRDEIYKQ